MKLRLSKLLLFAFLATLSTCGYAYAQSRTNRIFRDCPGTTTKAAVSVDVGGGVTITPCSGKTLSAPGVPLTSYLATSVAYTSNDVLANTALSVTIPAAGNYEIDVILQTTEDIGGLRLDFAGTATVGNFIGVWYGYELASPTTIVAQKVTDAGTDYTGIGAAVCFYRFSGSAEFSAGGTFILRGSQEVASISATTILRGSVLKLTKLN